jgi:hypothetical protein
MSKITYKECTQVFIDFYGEDRLDIGSNSIIVHYPEIIISNSKEEKDIIKDLYISFAFDGVSLKEIKGLRTTFSDYHYKRGYRHSHLASSSQLQFTPFCKGSVFTGIIMDYNGNQCYATLDRLLDFFDSKFINWESLEGGPHIKISSVYYTNNTCNFHKIHLNNLSDREKTFINKNLRLTNNFLDIPFTYFQSFTLDNEFTLEKTKEHLKLKNISAPDESTMNEGLTEAEIKDCISRKSNESFYFKGVKKDLSIYKENITKSNKKVKVGYSRFDFNTVRNTETIEKFFIECIKLKLKK